jgi:hypothetical protein
MLRTTQLIPQKKTHKSDKPDRGDAGSAHREDLNKNTMPTDPERPADAEWVNRTMSHELQR